MSACMSTLRRLAQKRLSRFARFEEIRDILRSKTSFCVTGAGLRPLFSFAWQGWHFKTLLKRLQAWIKIVIFRGYLKVNLDDVFKGSKV